MQQTLPMEYPKLEKWPKNYFGMGALRFREVVGKVVNLDIETIGPDDNGLNPYDPRTEILSIALSVNGKQYAFRLDEKCTSSEELHELYFKHLRLVQKIIESPEVMVCGHNIKFDLNFLCYKFKWKMRCLAYDTMLGAYFLNENDIYVSLEELCDRYEVMNQYKTKINRRKLREMNPDDELLYNMRDTKATRLIKDRYLDPALAEHELTGTMGIGCQAIPILSKMETRGVLVDQEYAKREQMKLYETLIDIRQDLKELAQSPFNPDSPKQLGEILFNKFDFNPIKWTDTGAGSTDSESIIRIRQEQCDDRSERGTVFVEKLLEYNKLVGLNEKYYGKLPKWIQADGCVHTSFNIGVTATGRLCIHPDTLIEMPRDLNKHPDGIPLKDVKVGDYVYSLDWNKRLCLKQVLWVGPTKKKAALQITVKSRWGKLTTFTVSKDHLVRMYNGDWRQAGRLVVGNRLCGFVHRGIDEYAYFFPSSLHRRRGESGGKVKEHRWIYAEITGKQKLRGQSLVHHIDENKLNNSPDNLLLVRDRKHHLDLHYLKKNDEESYKIITATNHTIIAIEPSPVTQLWDLEVEDTHTFFGGEVALHNSSSNPNMQNQKRGSEFRGVYIPRPGYIFLEGDFSQIELRIAAWLAKEKRMIQMFEEGKDIHTATLCEMTGRDYEDTLKLLDTPTARSYQEVKNLRVGIKNINFGEIYGASPERLQREMVKNGIYWELEECVQLCNDRKKLYPNIVKWKKNVEQFIINHKYVRMPLGQIRRLPDANGNWKDHDSKRAIRQGINFIIQSTASGWLPIIGMILLDRYFQQNPEWDGCILLQVHDSILCEVKNFHNPTTMSRLKEAMRMIMEVDVKEYILEVFGVDITVPLEFKADYLQRWR